MESIGKTLIKEAMAERLLCGDFIELRITSAGDILTSMYLCVAHIRKAGPRMVVFAHCDEVDQKVCVRIVDRLVEFAMTLGVARDIMRRCPRFQSVDMFKLGIKSVPGSLLRVEVESHAEPVSLLSRDMPRVRVDGAARRSPSPSVVEGPDFIGAMAGLAPSANVRRPAQTVARDKVRLPKVAKVLTSKKSAKGYHAEEGGTGDPDEHDSDNVSDMSPDSEEDSDGDGPSDPGHS